LMMLKYVDALIELLRTAEKGKMEVARTDLVVTNEDGSKRLTTVGLDIVLEAQRRGTSFLDALKSVGYYA